MSGINNNMTWRHATATIVVVMLMSVVSLMVMSILINTGLYDNTNLERRVISVGLLVVIYVGVVAVPGVVAISAILYRRRVFGELVMESGGLSRLAKVTVAILAVWTAIIVWIVGVAPTILT